MNKYSITMIRKRLFALICAITFIFLFIFCRLFYVQVVWGEKLQEKAVDQWTRNIPVLAKRGDIVDRNGVVLASSLKTYTVFVRPRAVTDLDGVCSWLSKVFLLDKESLKNKIKSTKISEIKVVKHATKEQINKLNDFIKNLDYNKHNGFFIPNVKEYDLVELLVEHEKYSKYNVHKGNKGCVISKYAINNKVEVDFTHINKDGNFCGDVIVVNIKDLKVIE